MKKLLCSLILIICAVPIISFSQTLVLQEHWWHPLNGQVNAIVEDPVNNRVYLGGDFTEIGPNVPYGAHIDVTSGAPILTFAKPNGAVNAALPDGSGGWYIGGAFTQVGGISRNRLAHINSSGNVSDWNPNASGTVNALAISGSTIFVGGNFTSIGGQTRFYMAALDATTGLATAWHPDANSIVLALAISGNTLYAGGEFTSIDGQPRNLIAAINTTTGAPTSWNPNANSKVNALAISGSTIYAGGLFTSIGGQARNRIAALDATTGTATTWNPNANSTVIALAISGSTIYAGGNFNNIGGQARGSIAALDASTGLATDWNPDANSNVNAIAISGSTIYAGGLFTGIGGQTRNRIAAIDATTGLATTWNPGANGNVYSLAVSGSTVYTGGLFTSIGGQTRNNIAALDATTGHLTDWNPNASSGINALAVSGGIVYAGGYFTSIGGLTRNRIAAIDGTTGIPTTWNPNASHTVNALAISGNNIYIGGAFTLVGGQQRYRIAAIDATTGLVTPWNPSANSTVLAISISNEIIYAGGNFTNIGGQTRNYIAALEATTGLATPWNPGASSFVNALGISGSTIYAGGIFTLIGGQARNRIAALDANTGTATSWNPNADHAVYALAVSGSTIYAGGMFTSIGGQPRNRVAALDATTGAANTWDPNANSIVHSLAISGSRIYVGGVFTSIGGQLRRDFAVFDFPPVATPEINVKGNAVAIGDGDATPDLSDHTDFGSVTTGNSITRTFTIQNTGTATLSVTGTSVTGTNSTEFVVTTSPVGTIAAEESATFIVTFTPTAPGNRNAIIHIASNDLTNADFDFAVAGTGLATWYKDADNDGYSDGTSQVAASQPADHKLAANLIFIRGDCNDNNAAIKPGANEVCDGIDNDCDASIDEGLLMTFYLDSDGDGYGNLSVTTMACSAPTGYVANNTDCNDAVATINPGAAEICSNGKDDNCNGVIDENNITTPIGIISGPDGVCRGATAQVFSVNAVPGATSYQWIIPRGATGISTTNSISLNFSNTYNMGLIAVKAIGACNQTSLSAKQIKYYSTKPGFPAYIQGKNLGTCTGPEVYSIPAVANATGYTWVAPANTSIVSGQGTTSIQLSFGPGFVSGTLFVSASNCLGTGSSRALWLQTKPSTPAAIVGPASVCPGATDVKFSTTGLAGLTYNWVVPAGATITGGQGTATITVTWGSVAGNVLVSAQNTCGVSANQAKAVSLPSCTPAPITVAQAQQVQANPLETRLELTLWPNPARDVLMITLDAFEPGKKIELTLMQADGKVQTAQSLMPTMIGQQIRIDVRQLSAGYHLMRARQGTLQQTKKVLIIR